MTAIKPVRLTLSRRKSFDLQAVSRQTNGLRATSVTRPGPWGNPFVVGQHGTAAYCVKLHEMALNGMIALCDLATREAAKALHDRANAHLHILSGQNLACWCHDGADCHATTLLHYANPTLFAAEIEASRAALRDALNF